MAISVTSESDRLFIKVGQTKSIIDNQGISESSWLQRFCGRATTITINGKAYSVNTNSLKKFLVRISTKDAQLQQMASKDAPETDLNKKIRDTAFNALTNIVKSQKQDFSNLLKNRILQLHRSINLSGQSNSIPFVTFDDALHEEKWNALFEKTIESRALPLLDLNGSNARLQTDGFIEISSMDVASDAERQERTELLSQFQAALEGFHLKFINGGFFNSDTVQAIIEKNKGLPIAILRKNTEIAKKLAAIVQSEKKHAELKLQKTKLEGFIQDTLALIEKVDSQIIQLEALAPQVKMILSKLDGKTLITDEELNHFSCIPQLHGQLLAYNHSISEIARLNPIIQDLDLKMQEPVAYLTALNQSHAELNALHEVIETANQRITDLNQQLYALTRTYRSDTSDKSKRVSEITHHLELLKQLLLSSPTSSALEKMKVDARRLATQVTLLSPEAVDEKISALIKVNQEQITRRDDVSNPTHIQKAAQEIITRNEQSLVYCNLFGNKTALNQEIAKLEQELKLLKKELSENEASLKDKIKSESSQLNSEIAQLHQVIKTNTAAFWKIVDSVGKSTGRKIAGNILLKIKASLTKKADFSSKAISETARFLADLHAEMDRCKIEIKDLTKRSSPITQELLRHQSTAQEQMTQLQTSLNLAPTIANLQEQSGAQELAHNEAEERLYFLKEAEELAYRAASDISSANLPTGHIWNNAVKEASLINSYYLLSTVSEGNFRSMMEVELKKMRRVTTSDAIDFSSYNNQLLLVGVQEWLTAQAV